jgi:dipeptidyl-peptidase 9
VSNWEAYDTGYTERYMGLPKDHPEAYRVGSVIENAAGFPDELDRLLVFHGGSDENVHFAHSTMVCQRLNELGKPYQFFCYPSDRHGISGTHSGATMIAHLQKHL